MDQTAVFASSGMRSRVEALDMLANNLANAATSGYKLDREFYSLFTGDAGADGEGQIAQLPQVKSHWTDFTQGTLVPTGNPLDLALDGQGFFVINSPTGPRYTRNGSFQLSTAGVLTAPDGYPVAGTTGQIQTQSQAPIEVTADGAVQQEGQVIGQLQIVDFKDKTALEKMGNSYFVNSKPAQQPTPAQPQVVQAHVEGSNVSPAEAAVRLVGVMRQSEMLQKAISTATDMNKQALQEVAKVGGAP